MSQEKNTKEEIINPFMILSEANALMNTLNSEENIILEEESDNFWINLISFNKRKSNHEKLKETYQDVKKMADAYLNEPDEQDHVVLKKFIV